MTLSEIEAQLEHLSSEELRRLMLRTWTTFVKKKSVDSSSKECAEDDPELLAALDEALAKADADASVAFTADDVRARLESWTSR